MKAVKRPMNMVLAMKNTSKERIALTLLEKDAGRSLSPFGLGSPGGATMFLGESVSILLPDSGSSLSPMLMSPFSVSPELTRVVAADGDEDDEGEKE